jgi:hypothetical protein
MEDAHARQEAQPDRPLGREYAPEIMDCDAMTVATVANATIG